MWYSNTPHPHKHIWSLHQLVEIERGEGSPSLHTQLMFPFTRWQQAMKTSNWEQCSLDPIEPTLPYSCQVFMHLAPCVSETQSSFQEAFGMPSFLGSGFIMSFLGFCAACSLGGKHSFCQLSSGNREVHWSPGAVVLDVVHAVVDYTYFCGGKGRSEKGSHPPRSHANEIVELGCGVFSHFTPSPVLFPIPGLNTFPLFTWLHLPSKSSAQMLVAGFPILLAFYFVSVLL